MINAVRHMLTNIYNNIPEEILELAFDCKGGQKSLDEAIIEKIIEARLVPDCSAISGQYKEIMLDPKWAMTSYIDQVNSPTVTLPYVVYKIPPEAREHRKLVAVLEITLPYGSMSSIAMMGGSSKSNGHLGINGGSFAEQAINGLTGQSNMLLPSPILLDGGHVKLIPMEYGIMQSYTLILHCRLEYDKDFTNLTPDAITQLSELGVTATKAFIYNKLVVKLDMGAIKSGQEIGRIREIIDSYADQQERYNVLREEFHGSAENLDVNTMYQRYLQGIFI